MRITDAFVRRPVLSSVISLLILLLGVRSLLSLELREYPKTEQALVTVMTAFPGADADLVQSFITEPLQRAASEAEGIDYVSSVSRQGVSIIQAYMGLNYDPYDALAEIQGKIAKEQLQQEVNHAKAELKKQVSMLAIAGAEKIIEREVDEKANKALLDNLIEEI